MSENENRAEDSAPRHDGLATRRKFLKGAAAAGAVAAMYTVPSFSSVHAKPAYASITGARTSPPEPTDTTPVLTVITFEDSAGTELAPGSRGAGTHWQESDYDVKALGNYHRASDGVSMAVNFHADFSNPGGIEITCVTGAEFSISSVDVAFDGGGATISSDKGGNTTLSPGTNNFAGSDWTGVSKVTIVTDNPTSVPVWIDNISVSKP